MPHPHDEVISRFYAAFAELDGEAMAACYAPDAHFSDPVFTDLRGAEPGAMWRMLTGRSKDLTVKLSEHEATDTHGTAHWLADYTFSTGRRVHDDVQAEFRFANGLIADHRDSFSFYAWSRQALGPVGLALGWTPIIPREGPEPGARGTRRVPRRRNGVALGRIRASRAHLWPTAGPGLVPIGRDHVAASHIRRDRLSAAVRG